MNRQEFLASLRAELSFLPLEERLNAIKYYEEYFEDAGEENEASILLELGSPKQVAEKILGDLGYKKDTMYKRENGGIELKLVENLEELEELQDNSVFNKNYGFNVNNDSSRQNADTVSTENIDNIESKRQEQHEQHEHKREKTEYNNPEPASTYRTPSPKKSTVGKIAIAVLLIFASPIWVPIVISAFALIISFFATFFMISLSVFSMAIAGGAVAITGIGLLAYGIAALFTSLFVAATSIGYGFLCLGGGIIFGYIFFKAAIFLFKWQFRITVKMLKAVAGAVRNMFVGRKYSTA